MKLALRNFGLRAGDGQIVHRAVHGQLADRSAGKKQRLHHKGIGAHGKAPAAEFEHCGIAQIFESGIAEGGQEQVLDQLVAQLAAAAVAHHDGGIVGRAAAGRSSWKNQGVL